MPPVWHGRVGAIVRGIALVLLARAEQRGFVEGLPALQLLCDIAATGARSGRLASRGA
jgi:hypothetical protein